MKVKISYTVDVDSIPGEIQGLVDKISIKKHKIDSQFGRLENSFKFESLESGLSQIATLRAEVFDLDVFLQDLDAITAGYLSMISHRPVAEGINVEDREG
ncbi:MAG: hypothetical protein HOJ16_07515 [Candidatus Peribacter sp.]|jgi:hypothetical protein|nr:hypothetical protein [Candidatus Peribacter sp.]MDB4335927.1 hypothetical protein [bacterium]